MEEDTFGEEKLFRKNIDIVDCNVNGIRHFDFKLCNGGRNVK